MALSSSLGALGRLGEVEPVVVVGAEGGVALGAFALTRLVPGLETVVAEDVEALDEHRVLAFYFARRTRQLLLQGKCAEEFNAPSRALLGAGRLKAH